MTTIIFAALAAIIHLYIFCLESLLWGRPKTNRTFGVSEEFAEYNRLFAFNQGFYNLFLAVAILVGLFVGIAHPVGKALVAYSLLSMMSAALVLVFSDKKMLRSALVQGLPPLLGLISLTLQLY